MRVLRGRGVNELFYEGVTLLRGEGVRSASRAGDVLVAPFPVTSVYTRPTQRVLFDETRDANPFFHLMEAMWMLAGRDDAAFLNTYVKDFGARFAEEEGWLHGAYGRRWRDWFVEELYDQPAGAATCRPIDQIEDVVRELRRNPTSRRAVIAMWDPESDLGAQKKDLPCNTHLYPRVLFDHAMDDSVLDLTICCRSNDIIWGAYGANAVHFSFLQEYLAAGVGVGVGAMYQISNNFHAYVDVFEKQRPSGVGLVYPYPGTQKLVDDFESFYAEVREFCEDPLYYRDFRNSFLTETCRSAAFAHRLWRDGKRAEAVEACAEISASDWRRACLEWMRRRMK